MPSAAAKYAGHPVAVLGGGITGLAAAWCLCRAGLPVVVLEASDRPGGVIGGHRDGEWLHELGPNSLLEGSAEVGAIVDAVGLGPRRLPASPAATKRYLVRGGRLLAAPASPFSLLATPLFSWRAKLGLLGEPFRPRRADGVEESVTDFTLRRLGREFLDYAVNPFVGGVYAGDPARLSIRHAFPKLHALERDHGSLVRGMFRRRPAAGRARRGMFSFPEGLGELPLAIAENLGESVRLDHRALAVRRIGTGWKIDCAATDGPLRIAASAVICALPAIALAGLAWEGVPGAQALARLVGEIPSPPVVSVFTGFRREAVAHPLDGFGVLVPAVEKRRLLGTLFSSSMFPGRAPAGHAALTTFVGGVRQPEVAAMSDAALLEVVQEELRSLLGASGRPAYVHVQRWPRAIPQYGLGHGRILDACAGVEASAPGLFIGGNFREGISVASCIESGQRLAAAAKASLEPNRASPAP